MPLWNKCPGKTYCCVPKAFPCEGSTDLYYERHLQKVEGGTWLEGYIPNADSGVTIATGYDLGAGPDLQDCLNDKNLWDALTPLRGHDFWGVTKINGSTEFKGQVVPVLNSKVPR